MPTLNRRWSRVLRLTTATGKGYKDRETKKSCHRFGPFGLLAMDEAIGIDEVGHKLAPTVV